RCCRRTPLGTPATGGQKARMERDDATPLTPPAPFSHPLLAPARKKAPDVPPGRLTRRSHNAPPPANSTARFMPGHPLVAPLCSCACTPPGLAWVGYVGYTAGYSQPLQPA